MSEFYDSLAKKLTDASLDEFDRALWRKIQDCYELCLGYSQYEEEREEMMQHLERLTKANELRKGQINLISTDLFELTKKVESLQRGLQAMSSMILDRLVKLEAEKQ